MTTLSEYRASIKRLLLAEDTDKAFQDEGFEAGTATLVSKSKSFSAARDAIRNSPIHPKK